MAECLTTVISGSYRKHLAQLYTLKNQLEAANIRVLSPVGSHAVNEGEEFIILNSDPVEDPRTLQDSVFTKIRNSSFLTVCNVDGYIGKAALLEIGYAIANGLQILTLEPVDDPNIAPYARCLHDVFGMQLFEESKAA